MTYSDLANKYPDLKIHFDSYILPIMCVTTNDEDLIEDMFSRLNEAVPLNAAEKRNAIGGPMAELIISISDHPFFKNKVRFTDRRYQHKEVAARLLFLEESVCQKRVIDTKKVWLDMFVRKYKAKNLSTTELQKHTTSVLNELEKIFNYKDILLQAQANVPIYYLLIRLALEQKKLKSVTRDKLENFRSKVINNRNAAEEDMSKADFDLLEYDRLSIQGTNDASSIKGRLRIICDHFHIKSLQF
jgi:hypothetical protein